MRVSRRTVLSLALVCLSILGLDVSCVFAQTISHESPFTEAHRPTPPTAVVATQLAAPSDGLAREAGTVPRLSQQSDWPSPVDDHNNYLFVLADVLEFRPNLGGAGSDSDYRWDIEGWYGGDYHRIWFKSEGQQNSAFKADYDVDSQLLYGRFIQQYYDLQVGLRLETQSFRRRNVTRGLAVIGLQGLVPYNYEIEPSLFISQSGHVSARLTATKDLSLSQRLILQLRFETNAAIQRVKRFTTGSGLNNLEGGIRLRYEIRREFAPYIGVSLDKSFGDTARLVRQEGGTTSQTRFVVGVRLWF